MPNNRNKSDLADAHSGLSRDAVTPLLYIYKLAEHADRQSRGKK